ncbi:MAG: hypothetical protein AAFX08_06260 [Pseudomonadota bacterium]
MKKQQNIKTKTTKRELTAEEIKVVSGAGRWGGGADAPAVYGRWGGGNPMTFGRWGGGNF